MFTVLGPVRLGRLDLRNRFIRSATWDNTADEAGAVTDQSVRIFENLAAGGVGLIITGYAFVSSSGRAAFGQYGIHSDEMIPGLSRLAQAAHNHGAKVAVQIVHSGALSPYLLRTGQVALAPSDIDIQQPHRAMTDEEIESVIDDFAAAAVRSREAGFDAVQIHGAHGYLMSQFLSPIRNNRQDGWGGSAENRRRFHIETVRRVRAAVGPNYPVWMKYGVMDDDEGGTTLEEGIATLGAMAEAGLDAVEISGGVGFGTRSAIRVFNDAVAETAYYRERAAHARRAVSIPVSVVGGVRYLETAENIVASGDADLISLCRPLIREPGLIKRWMSGDHRRARCISCSKCHGLIGQGVPFGCALER